MSDKASVLEAIDRLEHEMVTILIIGPWSRRFVCALFERMKRERHIAELGAPLEIWPERLQNIRLSIIRSYRQDRLN